MRAAQLGTALAAVGIALAAPSSATAAAGPCTQNGGNICLQAINASGGVVDAVFADAQGRAAPQLPVFGTLYNAWPGCPIANIGNYDNHYEGTESHCPNVPSHNAGGYDFATGSKALNHLDWEYGQPVRLRSGHGKTHGGACPSWDDNATWVDEDGASSHEGYVPREGLVWDLGGPSNRVAVFAVNDHGPQPCESAEYTVWLSDNPLSDEAIDDPTSAGADPQKWNRAVLQKIYTHGWIDQRAPGRPECGDTALYAVEADSFVTVYGLPCGIHFRYVAVAAGNDGRDFAACGYDSYDGEIDAVAGLTEDGSGVCTDADHDGFVDCDCPGAPAVCDCADMDPAVHPGAPERCDDADRDCDGAPGACAGDLVCHASVCVPICTGSGEFSECPVGSSCEVTDAGKLCVPKDCSAGCPAGSVCDGATGACRPACDAVTCPHGQICRDGACLDPCVGVVCPNQQVCEGGSCRPRCACFQGDVGCPTGFVCDRTGTSACVSAGCEGVSCAPTEFCSMGQCASACTGAVCPTGQRCDDATGSCVPRCQGVTCGSGQVCDPATGQCVAEGSCGCLLPAICVDGQCVDPDGGAPDASAGDASVEGGRRPSIQNADDGAGPSGGCGCRVAGTRGGTAGSRWAFATTAVAIFMIGRRRRRTR
jgi:hypothetical protein